MILKKMGLEIRKFGDSKSLLAEVDSVLNKAVDIQEMTVAHGLHKMLKPDGHLDVCFIREAQKILSVIIPEERMNIYHVLHCMNWNEMEADYRQTIHAPD